jgi:hypothetical protein
LGCVAICQQLFSACCWQRKREAARSPLPFLATREFGQL